MLRLQKITANCYELLRIATSVEFYAVTMFCCVTHSRFPRKESRIDRKRSYPKEHTPRSPRWLLHAASNEMKLLLEGSVKLCWMESSFVGMRPAESPETPMSLATETECCPGCNVAATESCSCVDSAISGLFWDLTPTHDDGQYQQHQQYEQQLGGGDSLGPSPSSTLNYHHHHHHHHRQLHHQQQPQQQQRHHRGELLLA